MGTGDRRRYNSPQRDQQASATRSAILTTAERLFDEHGFAAVTMQRLAREARVGLATVYLYFPGKAAVVAALAESIVSSPDLSVEQLERSSSGLEQLRAGARIISALNERSWKVVDILRSAQGTDEGIASVWRVWQERHLHAIERAVRVIERNGALREGLAFGDAVDTLYALAGTEVFRLLVRERSWTVDRYERWLFGLACRELLGVPPPEDEPGSSEVG